ncbi:septal ring lytic transglycosylase RlpA family protein [Thioalkalivibrio sp. ALJ24]|uniref:septal ring lytic transglycosylase RlpA family protein n=1 Tax=Thioalkalivibrio sp. ALJ24 TaxID=545276 RepID=UPI0009FF36BB
MSWRRHCTTDPRVAMRFGAGGATLALGLILAGCSGTPDRDRPLGDAAYDSYPEPDEVPRDLALLPDAEPTDEPPSRYGNPPEYEVFGQRYVTLSSADGFEEEGVASWYGTKFHGRRTSSGEPYDMYAMTAAHKKLPLPSFVEVEHLENGNRVVVRVNDRGPFVDDRIIDLSYAAAHRLGMTDEGVAPVRIRAVGPGDVNGEPQVAEQEASEAEAPERVAEPNSRQNTGRNEATGTRQVAAVPDDASIGNGAARYIQVGAFGERTSAQRLRESLQAEGFRVSEIGRVETAAGQELHRVRVGPLHDDKAVRETARKLESVAPGDLRIVTD